MRHQRMAAVLGALALGATGLTATATATAAPTVETGSTVSATGAETSYVVLADRGGSATALAKRLDSVEVSASVVMSVRARELAARINAPLAIVDKRRTKPGEVAEMTIIGEVEDQIFLIIDDICDTAGTLVKAADLLLNNGAKEVHAYISHGVLSGPAVERITSSAMKNLVITDSIEPTAAVKAAHNIRIVPTAPMFAQAILNIWNGTSVSSLFDTNTLVPIYEGMYPR